MFFDSNGFFFHFIKAQVFSIFFFYTSQIQYFDDKRIEVQLNFIDLFSGLAPSWVIIRKASL
jgi:hypothetical protein